MKPSVLVSALAAVALLGAGCAATDDKSQSADKRSAESREQPEYRTGSNLPRRDPRPKTKEERERAAEEAEQARRDAEKIVRPGT